MPQTHGSPFPRWKIALAVGGVVAAGGVAYWYFRRNRGSSSKPANSTKTGLKASTQGAAKANAQPAKPLSKAKQLKEEGNQCFKISDYQKAVEKYTAAVEACGPSENEDLSLIYQNRAAAYEKIGNIEAALEDCNHALEINPNYVKALMRRAKLYERLDRLEECFDDLGAALVCDRFENQEGLAMYDRTLKLVAERKAAIAIKNSEHAQFSRHRFAQLSGELHRDPILFDMKNIPSSAENGRSEEASEAANLYKKVLSEMCANRFAEAYDLLSDSSLNNLPQSNDTAKLHLVKASLAMTTNRYTEAYSELNLVIDSQDAANDVKVNALVKRAIIEQCTGRTPEAIESLKKADEMDKENVDVKFHMALMNLISENFDDGVNMLDLCVKMVPDHVAKIKRAMFDYMASSANGNVSRADTILDEILAYLDTHPGHTDFVELVGQMYCERAQFEKAEALYDKYLKTEDGSQNPTILILKSVLVLQWKQDTKTAESLIESALKLDPQCYLGYEALGLIKLQTGDVASALVFLERATKCCRSVVELTRILSLRESVQVQDKYARRFNVPLGGGMGR